MATTAVINILLQLKPALLAKSHCLQITPLLHPEGEAETVYTKLLYMRMATNCLIKAISNQMCREQTPPVWLGVEEGGGSLNPFLKRKVCSSSTPLVPDTTACGALLHDHTSLTHSEHCPSVAYIPVYGLFYFPGLSCMQSLGEVVPSLVRAV